MGETQNPVEQQWLAEFREFKAFIITNTERLKVVVDTTHEIKEQLLVMNGRVRQNREDIVAIKVKPSITREHCDRQRSGLDEKRDVLERRIGELEKRLPSIIQNIVMALLTGGAMALVYYFLSKVP